MKIIKDIKDYNKKERAAVTIGSFDGVHLGHQKILKRVVEVANKNMCKSVVVTFEPHPRMVLNENENEIKLLNTNEEKIGVFAETGIDILIILPFTKSFSKISPIEFVRDYLINMINAKYLILGYDHHFGNNRRGNLSFFKDIDENNNSIIIEEVKAQYYSDITISSTKIRNAIHDGEIKLANSMLGYHFLITGSVIKGNKIGRKIGFPTANIKIKEKFKVIPPKGVYAVDVNISNVNYKGMLNIGIRPTLNLKEETIELNVFDFDDDLYGKVLKIAFLERIRNEKKFENINLLKDQLKKDQNNAKNILDNNSNKSFRLFD